MPTRRDGSGLKDVLPRGMPLGARSWEPPAGWRTAALCAASYVLGIALLPSGGGLGQTLLLGFSILVTVVLGLRAGLVAVVINSATLLVGARFGWSPTAPGLDGAVGWPTLEFAAADAAITIAIGAVLAAVDAARRRDAVAALKESEERLRVLNDLAEATRAVSRPEEIIAVSLTVLGRHLEASRCAYAFVDADGDGFTVPDDYTNGCASSAGRHRLSSFGPRAVTKLRSGRTLVVRDVDRELTPDEGGTNFTAAGIKAVICCSLVRKGTLVAMLAVHQSRPRDWTLAEIALVEAVCERSWATIERRAAEQKLRLSEQHLRAVIDTTPECVTLVAPDATIIETNAAGLAMKEAARLEDVVGTSIARVIAPEDYERVAAFHSAVCSGQSGRIQYDLIGLKGGRRTVETVSAPLADGDGRLLHLAITRDVTEKIRLEEQLRHAQKMEAIGRLAGGIAHDFNNLLTVVLGYCHILTEKRSLASADQELLDEIRRAGERAAVLTRQLLAFGRKQVLEPRVLNLNAIVVEMERMLRRLIGEDVALTTSLQQPLWSAKVDAGQIEQVIVNLVVNARDAMPNGGKLIVETANVEWTGDDCRERAGRTPGRFVALSITDTGVGMSPELVRQIFEPFFTTKDVGKGTGLGLSVVHGIVEQSGGVIEVHSDRGVGSSFIIFFPAVEGVAKEAVSPRARARSLRGTETVLLVEDEAEVRTLLRRALEEHGYTVVEAADGEAALAAARAFDGPIDAVVTDVVMPERGGRELVAALRELRPAIKVLYVSGYTDDTLILDGDGGSPRAFLQKPFPPRAVIDELNKLFEAAERVSAP